MLNIDGGAQSSCIFCYAVAEEYTLYGGFAGAGLLMRIFFGGLEFGGYQFG